METPADSGDRGTALLATTLTSFSLACVVVLLRLYVRVFRQRNAWWDDVCVVLALALSIFGIVCNKLYIYYGIGKHMSTLEPWQISRAILWLTAVEPGTFMSLFLIRLSVFLFLLRLLPASKRRLRIIIFSAISINFMATVTVIVVFCTQCIPLAGYWDPNVHARCFSHEIATVVQRIFSAINALTDFTAAIIPLLFIFETRLDQATKINLCLVMSLGLLTAGCAIARAIVVDLDLHDFTWKIVPACYTAVLEANLGLIFASLPGLRQFFFVIRSDYRALRNKRSPGASSSSADTSGAAKSAAAVSTSDADPEADLDFFQMLADSRVKTKPKPASVPSAA